MPVTAGEIKQRVAIADRDMHYFANKKIVIAQGDNFVDLALDRRQYVRQQGNPGDAPAPLQAIEAVVSFAREAVRERLLVRLQDIDGK